MTICDNLLAEDIIVNCADLAHSSFRKKAWIFNFDDVEYPQAEITNTVSNFTLKAGKRGYIVEQLGSTPYEGTNTALVVSKYSVSFTNQVQLFIPDSVGAGRIIDTLSSGKFIVCLDNGVGGIRIYGYYNGLKAIEATQTPYNDETDGGWLVKLEETKAQRSRIHMAADDKTKLDDLCKETA